MSFGVIGLQIPTLWVRRRSGHCRTDSVDFQEMPRSPRCLFACNRDNPAHTSARRGAHGLSRYQTWWRSGRDSNSRTGYARFGISSADSRNRLILGLLYLLTSIGLEPDYNSSSTLL